MLINRAKIFYNDTVPFKHVTDKKKMQVYIPQGKLLRSNNRGETMPGATEALADRHS
jgi:hypothetical protein